MVAGGVYQLYGAGAGGEFFQGYQGWLRSTHSNVQTNLCQGFEVC